MSGCQPTDIKCGCMCHRNGFRAMLTRNPPQDCCDCPISNNIPNLDPPEEIKYVIAPPRLTPQEETTVYLYEKISTLEFKIKQLEDRSTFLESENKMRKDTIGCLDKVYDEAYKEFEEKIKILEKGLSNFNFIFKKDTKDELSINFKNFTELLGSFDNKTDLIIEEINEIQGNLGISICDINNIKNEISRLERNDDELECKLGDKISDLENIGIEDRLNKLESKKSSKEYGCPNCFGLGKIEYYVKKAENNSLMLNCVLCQGKGVVNE